MHFNPLPHTRENIKALSMARWKARFQSTPSYEGEQRQRDYDYGLRAISIHSLIRGRTFFDNLIKPHFGAFQSTPSYEGEPKRVSPFSRCAPFQSTPSYEGERICRRLYTLYRRFQSTPSYEGEQPLVPALLPPKPKFQSTPSYEGEHYNICIYRINNLISIHSLIRGRTSFTQFLLQYTAISIHSLIRGRTVWRV